MKLNNPPVIQTWIGFTFEPPAEKRPWNIQTAAEFLSRFESSLPHREAIFETKYKIQEISPVQLPEIVSREIQLDRARARNDEGTHWLQLADDRIVYNHTRGDGAYLGFASLRDEALSKLREYVAFFGPSSLRSAELHYVDQIEIPIPPGGELDLEEYFKLRVEIPNNFGPTWGFSTRLFLRPPVDGDILDVKFETALPIPDATVHRFRVDWHMVCFGIGVFEQDVVKTRLDRAHDHLTACFEESVTERTWALFEPLDQDEE